MSPQLKVRDGGAWVPSNKSGAVRLGGVTIPFAPEGGAPDYEAIAWTNPVPDLVDADDGSTRYNMGVLFDVDVSKPCYGVEWRAPNTTPSPTKIDFPFGHIAQLWDLAENKLAEQPFEPVPGVYQDILFDTPFSLVAGTEYIVSIYTFHYTFRAGQFPATSPSGNIDALNGRLSFDVGPTFPTGTSAGCFYISPLVGL